ncbi:RagB/SusD family nutrient uptake outer membrane protein [Paludibacteraceae bacterium OttesenSCG-928-F17]|nr:RagB/SusD family nutrient uptake outer membrane protein [Paludibacteraceae bacterium OttesenSCG-928-F17]
MKKLIYLIIVAFVFMGCGNFLNKTPDNRAELSTPKDIASLLVAAYPQQNHVWFTELRSDNTTDVGPTAPADDATRRQSYYWQRVEAQSQDTPDGFFFSTYGSIAAINHALQAIEKMEKEGTYSKKETDPLRGEALVARAYNHFMLVNLFAEHYDPATAATYPAIAYVTTVEDRPIMDYERLTVEQVYNLIEKDLLEGLSLIADDSYSQPKWHFNKKAANTFASRFYLFRGLYQTDDNGEDDWDKVIRYANLALEGKPESFLRDWSSTYRLSMDAFGTEYSRSTNRANFLICSNISVMTRNWYYRYTMDLDLLRARTANKSTHPINDTKFEYLLSYKGAGAASLGCYNVFKFNEIFKRDGINANFGYPYVMYTPIVAEEALFNLMEAYTIKERYDDVLDLFNKYYAARIKDYNTPAAGSDYSVTNLTIEMKYGGNKLENWPQLTPHFISRLSQKQIVYLTCIVNVRASEFVGEGHRWFDIKRMHIPVTHKIYPTTQMVLEPNDPRRVINLPAEAEAHIYDNGNINRVQAETMFPVSTIID